jgi:hypothetical protein
MACKITLKVALTRYFQAKFTRTFLAQHFHLSLLWSLASLLRAGHLVVQDGTSKISGCTIVLHAGEHPGILAPGTRH